MKTKYDEAAITAAEDYEPLGKLFLKSAQELSKENQIIYQVCGPIAANAKNTVEAHLATFAKAVDTISNLGLAVVDQIPYEPKIQELKAANEKIRAGYDTNILDIFYLPLFKSGIVKVLVFLPGWRDSFGSRWEYIQGKIAGMKILEFVEDWQEIISTGSCTALEHITKPMLDVSNTHWQYNEAVKAAKGIFEKKAFDYGGLQTVVILRIEALIDQLFIKLWRVRTLQDNEKKGIAQKVSDDKVVEFKGLINYSVIALLRRKYDENTLLAFSDDDVLQNYDSIITEVRDLMLAKNHDYGEAWRMMQQFSYIDLSIAKIMRMKEILKKNEQTLASEGIEANFHDIINYSIFAMIMISEGKHTS